jgi:hypothetical protein
VLALLLSIAEPFGPGLRVRLRPARTSGSGLFHSSIMTLAFAATTPRMRADAPPSRAVRRASLTRTSPDAVGGAGVV